MDNVLFYSEVVLPGLFWYAVFKCLVCSVQDVKGHLKLSLAFSGDRGNEYSTSVDVIGNQGCNSQKIGGGESSQFLMLDAAQTWSLGNSAYHSSFITAWAYL